jgi:hypothetical protein
MIETRTWQMLCTEHNRLYATFRRDQPGKSVVEKRKAKTAKKQ